MLLAEAAESGWHILSVDTQIVISNWGIVIVTTLGSMIEIYKLTKIEHELKLITRLISVIKAPMRMRRMVAHRRVRKIARQAATHVVDLPAKVSKAETIKAVERRIMQANDRKF